MAVIPSTRCPIAYTFDPHNMMGQHQHPDFRALAMEAPRFSILFENSQLGERVGASIKPDLYKSGTRPVPLWLHIYSGHTTAKANRRLATLIGPVWPRIRAKLGGAALGGTALSNAVEPGSRWTAD